MVDNFLILHNIVVVAAKTLTIFLVVFITMGLLYTLFHMLKRVMNNKKYKDGIDCPKCGNKMQLIRMTIFDKSKDECHICGFKEYSHILRK